MRKPAKGSLTPRNGHLAVAMFRSNAGAHGKTKKILRRDARMALAKQIRAGAPGALRDAPTAGSARCRSSAR